MGSVTEYYCGVGSRSAPPPILAMMERIAAYLRGEGWVLRSGHADGSDQAFERGAAGQAQIFIPWQTFNYAVAIQGEIYIEPLSEAFEIAERVHPAWSALSPQARTLHARNCHQVLGPDLDDPVRRVVCWTPGGKLRGGTATAIRLARDHGIPVINLGQSKGLAVASAWLP